MVNLGQRKTGSFGQSESGLIVFKLGLGHIVSVIKLGEGHLLVYGQSRTESVSGSVTSELLRPRVSWDRFCEGQTSGRSSNDYGQSGAKSSEGGLGQSMAGLMNDPAGDGLLGVMVCLGQGGQ